MIPVMGIPYYNRPDLLLRCVRSIDYPVARLVIVDNSPGGLDDRTLAAIGALPERLVTQIHLIRHPANAGVAASWNQIIAEYPADWWMLVNNDIQFAQGDLERMAVRAIENHADYVAMDSREVPPEVVGCFYANHSASMWIVTEYGIECVGTFDENFYPAYCEDCDWSRRADVLGVPRRNVGGCSSVHGDGRLTGSCTVNADAVTAANNVRTHGGNNTYYAAKWGGSPDHETFKTPFNGACPPFFWRLAPRRRREQQWK